MAQAYRIHRQVEPDGTLTLDNLPFQPGEEVEVIVLAEERHSREGHRYPLRGQPPIYDDPTAPVAGIGLADAPLIILDTHIWIWWVHGDPRLTQTEVSVISAAEATGVGVRAISWWEVAKLVQI